MKNYQKLSNVASTMINLLIFRASFGKRKCRNKTESSELIKDIDQIIKQLMR